MKKNTLLLAESIKELFESKNYAAIRAAINATEPQDLAIVCEELDGEMLIRFFRLMPKTVAAETFTEMETDTQESVIRCLSDSELRAVLDELYIDDTVDVIEEMPANVVKRILANSDRESRAQINCILNYPKDSAGSIMTVEYTRLDRNMSVSDAFARIRRVGVDKETIYTCYVTDHYKKLVGVVTAKNLMLSDPDTLVSELMDTDVIYVTTDEDKESVAMKMSHYDFLAMPVVDGDMRLVGIVTFDDAMDIVQDAATEDIEKMAAITPSDKAYLRTGVIQTWLARIPWLLLLMISAALTGAIISHYEEALGKVIALTAFIPMLMDTSGNAGSQSSVTVIRALSLGEIEPRDIFSVLWKELRVSLLCSLSLAAVGYGKIILTDNVEPAVALTVCLTLAITVVIAKLVGCIMPLFIKRIGFDPAVVASPFITTIVDAIALVVYFAVSAAFIPALK